MEINDYCANFLLPSTEGESFELLKCQTPLLIYFYPRDNTPGCTNEALDFNQSYDGFVECGVKIIGISRDSIKSHMNFKTKHELKFDLLSDQDEKVCQLFGVIKEKNLYGKKMMGIERSTFVLNASHQIVGVWRGVKVPGHVDAVLTSTKTLFKKTMK